MISLKRGGVTISQFGQQIAYLFFFVSFFIYVKSMFIGLQMHVCKYRSHISMHTHIEPRLCK